MVKRNRSKITKKELPCASADTFGRSVRFIMDTGCGHDLISERKVKELGLKTFLDNDGMTFMTADELIDSNEITVVDHEGLGQCKLHVLNQTPAVLSIGSRCTKEGYTFVWPEGEEVKPVMINDEGVCIFLEVDGDIPYLIPNNVRDTEVTKEGRRNLVKHLESLIQKLKIEGDDNDNINPKAMAGEDSGEDFFRPSDEEPEEPHREEEDPKDKDEKPPPVLEPGDGEDPEGLIEVDVDHGESRYAKPATLKREAKALDHLMTHRYSNPYCDSCIRA